MVINHLLTGMILQVGDFKGHVPVTSLLAASNPASSIVGKPGKGGGFFFHARHGWSTPGYQT